MNVRAFTDELTAYRMASRLTDRGLSAVVRHEPGLGCGGTDVWLMVPNETTIAAYDAFIRRSRAWLETIDAPSHPDDCSPFGIVRPMLGSSS
ncbi:MAG: hypothetical protein WKF45_01180 [Ilumatobacteraceae bacterium]